MISRSPMGRVDEVLAKFPELAGLRHEPALSAEQGAVTTVRRLRRVATGNVALVGDASGSVDAITGEGIGLAFQQVLALREALREGTLAGYNRAHTKLCRRPRWMSRLLLTCDRRPGLARFAMRALVAHPPVFQWLASVHVGEWPAMASD